MKLFAKLMIAVLFIAMMLPFTILKGPDGKTLMSLSDISLPDFSMPKMPKFSQAFEGSEPIPGDDSDLSGKDLFYQWYDAQGNVQFTTEPPAQGIEYTIKGFDPNTNVIQAVKKPPEQDPMDEADTDEQKSAKSDDFGNPYSGDSIKKLLDDARNVEKLINQRFKDQESALNQ
jgi:hypothetical protein